ncbi:hypothetical protein GCM10011391_33440 [Pullulanibacillus camelliae]|uniref:Cytosolic protein n=1 Tax=Pullulanibacillus camelliae TaxID=1707096 RepID=A0A8J2YLJ6_9BACL|nr:cytosolic protein [Pullulanibacillus camelliae]GGE51928.1 hypothetical protein GCM10011391_33440 [Pullulanibacillus camelliae]
MGMMSKLSAFFNSHVETSERNEDETLRTHYYKTTKDKLMDGIQSLIASEERFSLLDASKERGEISVNVVRGKKGFLVITVVNVRPFKTSVDISFTVEKGMNLGYGQKMIRQFYQRLDKEYTFVGVGINEQ